MQIIEDSGDIYCIMVEPFLVKDLWDKCLPFLENPEIGEIEFGNIDDLKQECIEGYAQLWILMRGDDLCGCFCTNFGEVDSGTNVVNIFRLSGEGAKVWIKELDKKISEFAIANNCKFYLCTARKGFARYVPELKEAGTLFVKDLCKKE